MGSGERGEARGSRLEKGRSKRKRRGRGSAWEGGMIVRGAETEPERARGREEQLSS